MKQKKVSEKSVVLSKEVEYTDSMSIPLTNDVIFKYVFGAKESERLLLSLVNAVLTDYGFVPIVSLDIKNPIMLKETNWMKGSVLDIRAQDSTGTEYDIEMQVSNEAHFKDRSLFYWARQYASQLESGEDYGKLKPVICINLIDFVLIETPDLFHSCFITTEKNHPDLILSRNFQIHFVELPKAVDFTGKLADWARLLAITDWQSEEAMNTLLEKDESFVEAYDRYKKCLRDRRAYQDAISRQMWQLDQNTRRKTAERQGFEAGLKKGQEEGVEKGLQQGIERGIEQGIERGIEQGVEQGIEQARYDMAKKLSGSVKMSSIDIATVTGLPVDEIENLLKKQDI